jgi:hypothetical protein
VAEEARGPEQDEDGQHREGDGALPFRRNLPDAQVLPVRIMSPAGPRRSVRTRPVIATVATRTALTPMVGSKPLSTTWKVTATATRTEPRKKLTNRTHSVGMPVMVAPKGSFSTARMAFPTFVRRMKRVTPPRAAPAVTTVRISRE